MKINPYAAAALAQNQNNFPSCRLFFPCSETSGGMLTDAMQDITYTPTPGSLSFMSNGVQVSSANTAIDLSSTYDLSTSNAPATFDFMLIAILGQGFAGFGTKIYLGNGAAPSGSNDAIAINDLTTSQIVMSDAPGSATLTHTYTGALSSHVVVGRWTGTTLNIDYYVDGTAPVTASIASASDPVFGYSLAQSKLLLQGGTVGLKLYELAYFSMTKGANLSPTDIATGALWMRDQAVLGNKSIYPGWKGL